MDCFVSQYSSLLSMDQKRRLWISMIPEMDVVYVLVKTPKRTWVFQLCSRSDFPGQEHTVFFTFQTVLTYHFNYRVWINHSFVLEANLSFSGCLIVVPPRFDGGLTKLVKLLRTYDFRGIGFWTMPQFEGAAGTNSRVGAKNSTASLYRDRANSISSRSIVSQHSRTSTKIKWVFPFCDDLKALLLLTRKDNDFKTTYKNS